MMAATSLCSPFLLLSSSSVMALNDYPIVDLAQSKCWDIDGNDIDCDNDVPLGQDAQYSNLMPSYCDNLDGTATDLNTGLMWTQDNFGRVDFTTATSDASTINVGGHTDWRVPTIKELYSLIQFNGQTGDSEMTNAACINKQYFNVQYVNHITGRYISTSQLIC